IAGSADIVLPEPGLGLVYTEGGVFSEGQAIIFRRESLFIEGVSGFVDTAPGHVAEVLFIDTGGDADVVAVEAGGERMFGDILASGEVVEADPADDVHAEVPLLLTGKIAVQETVVYLGLGGYAA